MLKVVLPFCLFSVLCLVFVGLFLFEKNKNGSSHKSVTLKTIASIMFAQDVSTFFTTFSSVRGAYFSISWYSSSVTSIGQKFFTFLEYICFSSSYCQPKPSYSLEYIISSLLALSSISPSDIRCSALNSNSFSRCSAFILLMNSCALTFISLGFYG